MSNIGKVIDLYSSTEDKIFFNQRYSIAPNMVCEEHFTPVSNRYKLD